MQTVSTLGDKLKRLVELNDVTQLRVSRETDINQGHLSDVMKNKRRSLPNKQLERLASFFGVPTVYFLSNSPRDYIGAVITHWTPEQRAEFRALPLHKKIFSLLEDLAAKWGDEFSLKGVSEWTGISLDSLTAMVEGTANLSDHLIECFCDKTGFPIEMLIGSNDGHTEPDIPPAYLQLAKDLFQLGIPPEKARKLINTAYTLSEND